MHRALAASLTLCLVGALALAAESREVSGRVLGPDGEPLAGARVEIAFWTPASGQITNGPLGVRSKRPAAATRDDGTYELTVPADATTVHVGVRAGGCSPGWSGEVALDGGEARHDFRLQPTTTVVGRVIDEATRKGVGEAAVTVYPWWRHDAEGARLWTWFAGHPAPEFTARANAAGRFEIPDMPAGAYTAAASHDGYDSSDPGQVYWAAFPQLEASRPLELPLRRTSTRTVDGVALPAGVLRMVGSPHTALGVGAYGLVSRLEGAEVAVFGDETRAVVDIASGELVTDADEIPRASELPRLFRLQESHGRHPVRVIVRDRLEPRSVVFGVPVHAVAAVDDEHAGVALEDGRLAIVDATSAKEVWSAELSTEPLSAIVALPDGVVAVGTWREVVLYDTQTRSVVRRIDALSSQVLRLAVDEQGERIAAGGVDEVVVLDARTGKRLDRVSVESPTPVSIAADGYAIAYHDRGRVYVRYADQSEHRVDFPDTPTHLLMLRGTVAVLGKRTGLHLFDPRTREDRMDHGVHAGRVYRVDTATAPDGRALVATLSADAVALWDARTGAMVRRDALIDRPWPRDVRISDDGTLLHVLCGGWATTSIATGKPVDAADPAERGPEILSPDGRLALRPVPRTATMEVVRTRDDEPVFRLPFDPRFAPHAPGAATFDADGNLVTVFGAGALVWDTGRLAD